MKKLNKLFILLIVSLSIFFIASAEDYDYGELSIYEKAYIERNWPEEKPKCLSSFRVYNNTSQNITINNGADVDNIPSGSYSFTVGECGTPVEYSVNGSYSTSSGNKKTCSYSSAGEILYPEEHGTYYSTGITTLCGNEEQGYEVKAFTDNQLKLAGWSASSNPKEYAYSLLIKATYEENPLANVTYTITDTRDRIVKDIYGNEAVATTGENGKVYFYLFAGYDYKIKQTDIDKKYSIKNGTIKPEKTNATILKSKDFSHDSIKDFFTIAFENDSSDEEIETLQKIENEKNSLLNWKEGKENEVEKMISSLDHSKYNKNAEIKFEEIKTDAFNEINEEYERLLKNVEISVREELENKPTYSLFEISKRIEEVPIHWQHWFVLALIFITCGLHFIFNKHLLISLTILIAGGIYLIDMCKFNIWFGIAIAIVNLVFIILGKIFDNDIEEFDDEQIV